MKKSLDIYKCKLVKEKSIDYLGSVSCAYDVQNAMKKIGIADSPEEHFGVFCLNVKGEIIAYHEVSHGELAATNCHPREVFKRAILSNAAGIICVHNHPSGDVTPSDDDIIGIFAGGGSSNSFDDENAVIYSYENIGDVIYEDDDTNAKLMSFDISNINTTDKSLKINLLVKTKSGEFPSGLIMTNCLMCNEEDSVATSATVSGTENEKSGWDVVIDFATPDKLFGTDIKEAKGNLSFGGDAVPTVFKLSGSEKLAKSVISISKIWVEPGAYSFSKPRLHLNFTNKSDKTIKYLDFETKYYNKVGDEVQEGDYENINIINSYRHEGPIKKGEGLSGSYWGWDVDVKDAKTVELSGLVIEYMDGTILHFDDKMLEAVK